MTALRDRLRADLEAKVAQHGLVIWSDEHREYGPVAAEVTPDGVPLYRFDGTWFELRTQLEPLVSGDQPRPAVVYVDAPAPAEDPLLELRSVAGEYKVRLATLARQVVGSSASKAQLDEITKNASTILDAEAVVVGGPAADLQVIAVVGSSDLAAVVEHVLVAGADLNEDQSAVLRSFLDDRLGAVTDSDALQPMLFRRLALAEVTAALDDLPEHLAGLVGSTTAAQRAAATNAAAAFWAAPRSAETFALAAVADSELQLSQVPVMDGLEQCQAGPGIDEVVFGGALELLDSDRWEAVNDLARQRSTGRWSRPGPSGWEERAARWRAVSAVASLRAAIARTAVSGSGGAVLDWYAAEGFEVDRAHRRFELARQQLVVQGSLEPYVDACAGSYETWLDEVIRASVEAASSSGFDGSSLMPQGDVHDAFVQHADGIVAYILVDALRYELGADLVRQLDRIPGTAELRAGLAAAPTITPVGMANLLPASSGPLEVRLEGSKLAVFRGQVKIAGVPQRIDSLRAAHGTGVVDLQFDKAVELNDTKLREHVQSASVLVVRSQELDAQGESGMLQAAWPAFVEMLSQLSRLVARLGHAGVTKVVVTADHGFVALPRSLADDRTIDAPTGGTGEIHRRAWIGKGAVDPVNSTRVQLSHLGVTSDLDIVTPDGLAVFRGGGSKQFFHGGLSPQELVIPVVVVEFEGTSDTTNVSVDIAVAGGRITTATFAASLTFTGDLFTDQITVRVVVGDASSKKDHRVVAQVVSGDGFDPATGSLTLRAGEASPLLAFHVTGNLAKGDRVTIEALDTRTGMSLGSGSAEVAAPIIVEDDLS